MTPAPPLETGHRSGTMEGGRTRPQIPRTKRRTPATWRRGGAPGGTRGRGGGGGRARPHPTPPAPSPSPFQAEDPPERDGLLAVPVALGAVPDSEGDGEGVPGEELGVPIARTLHRSKGGPPRGAQLR